MISRDWISVAFRRTEKAILEFSKGDKIISDDQTFGYDHWNRKDVVAHIEGWLAYSANKLRQIIEKKPIQDFSDLDEFNRALYRRNQPVEWPVVLQSLGTTMAEYQRVLFLFQEEDLGRTDLPTGFSFELWKYLLLDGVIHPIQHLLYQQIKDRDAEGFSKLCQDFFEEFWKFSDEGLDAFDLKEFLSNDEKIREKIEQMLQAESLSSLGRVILERNGQVSVY